MRIARVFPTITSMTPTDQDAYYGPPELFTPYYDKVYVSAVFTWDREKAKYLADCWHNKADEVLLGGPAFGDRGEEFIPGMFLKEGIGILSRGCPNKCWFCQARKREGGIREIGIKPCHIEQSNNILACSRKYLYQMFRMMRSQKAVEFRGGLEAKRLDWWFIYNLTTLPSLKSLWLAYDTPDDEEPLKNAIKNLRTYFGRNKIYVYVLIGFPKDTMDEALKRLVKVWRFGGIPFAMLYRDENNTPQTKDWRRFQREWMRPAIIKSNMKALFCQRNALLTTRKGSER